MRKILAVLLVMLCFGCVNAHAQKLSCGKFHNGTFRMEHDGMVDTVIRAGAIQTELFNNTKKGTFNVKWTEECTYTLIPTEETLKNEPNMPRNMVVTVKLSNTVKNTCTQTITNNLTAEIITMDVEKIK